MTSKYCMFSRFLFWKCHEPASRQLSGMIKSLHCMPDAPIFLEDAPEASERKIAENWNGIFFIPEMSSQKKNCELWITVIECQCMLISFAQKMIQKLDIRPRNCWFPHVSKEKMMFGLPMGGAAVDGSGSYLSGTVLPSPTCCIMLLHVTSHHVSCDHNLVIGGAPSSDKTNRGVYHFYLELSLSKEV